METNSQIKELTDFIDDMPFADAINYENKIIVVDLCHLPTIDEDHLAVPIRLNAFTILLVAAGEFYITIDYKPYTIKKNTLFTLIEKHLIHNISSSEDFQGFHIIIEHEYFKGATDDEKPPLDVFNVGQPNPIELSEADSNRLISNIEKLKEDILRTEHSYQTKMIKCDLANLTFEMWNLLTQRFKTEIPKQPNTYEQIVARFFDLLFKYATKEREVSFYANKLNFSPIYLSRVVKQVTGRSTIKVISDIVMIEAKTLLRSQQINIQQIADKLNFSDQASFSKFFKKNAGISPIEYRKCL